MVRDKKQYKVCRNCKADYGDMCLLGFKKELANKAIYYKPIEACYKPKKESELLSLSALINMGKA